VKSVLSLLVVAVAAAASSLTSPVRAADSSQLTLGGPDVWKVDTQNSAAGFAVRHMLVSTVRGHLGPVSGTVWYDGKSVESIRADISIDVKSLQTGNDTRDAHLRTDDFFNAAKYPSISFKSKRVAAGEAGRFTLVGDLTIRNVTKEVSLDVEGPAPILKTQREQRTAATATATVNRFDYGLRWNDLIETGGAVVGSDVKITIDLQVTRSS
jgi:polyisoprenoid-binding protein YceI